MNSPAPTLASRPNRDGLAYALASLALDIVAAALLGLSLWNLASLDVPQAPPHLDGPRPDFLRGLLTFILVFAPILLAGWGHNWGAHSRTLASLSAPYVRWLAWLSVQLSLLDVIAWILLLILSPMLFA